MSDELRDARDNNANNNDINNDDGDMNKNINFNRREDSPSRANNKGSEKVKGMLFLARLGKRGRSSSRHAHKEEVGLGMGAGHNTRIGPNTRTMTGENKRIGNGFSIRPFAGIIQDIRARAPYYLSDWKDAYNYRVIPATLLIFFAK